MDLTIAKSAASLAGKTQLCSNPARIASGPADADIGKSSIAQWRGVENIA